MELEFKYAVGKRIDSCLVYTSDKQLFRFTRNKSVTAKQYSCYFKSCKAKVVVQNGVCTYEENNALHNHEDNQEKLYKKCAKQHKIKQRCRSDPNMSIKKIFEEENGSLSDSSLTFDQMKSSMIQNKKKGLPKNPSTAVEINSYLNNELVQDLLKADDFTLDHEFVSEDEFSYLLFECKVLLEKLPEERHFIFNCSMRVVPLGFFTSLMTIMVVKDSKVSNRRAHLEIYFTLKNLNWKEVVSSF